MTEQESAFTKIGNYLQENYCSSSTRRSFDLPDLVLPKPKPKHRYVKRIQKKDKMLDSNPGADHSKQDKIENSSGLSGQLKKEEQNEGTYDGTQCTRTLPYDRSRQVSAKSSLHVFHISSLNDQPEKKGLITRTQNRSVSNETMKSSRAERANQRRMLRSICNFSHDSFAINTLVRKESALIFARSRIHAWGVFTRNIIRKDELICEYRGEIIGNKVADRREIAYEKQKIGSDYMFRVDQNTVVDATHQGSIARFINASCSPNCYTQIIQHQGKKRIGIYAKRVIYQGEELFYDYKFPLEGDESKWIACNCGSKDCRGFMNWDNKLSLKK